MFAIQSQKNINPFRMKSLFITQTALYIYIRGSVHRNYRLKKSNDMQQYADIYLLLNYYMFHASIAPVIRST